MALEPVRFLVAPKLIAMMLMLPCLTTWADFMGVVRLIDDTAHGLSLLDFLALDPKHHRLPATFSDGDKEKAGWLTVWATFQLPGNAPVLAMSR